MHEVPCDGHEKAKNQILYELQTPPDFYIQGSKVMDRLFNTDTAQDIDVFHIVGGGAPTIPGNTYIHATALDPESYFPPQFGSYNTDRYILINNEVVRPVGWPRIPHNLELMDDHITISEVIRGIKYTVRYKLKPSERTLEKWRETLSKQYDTTYMAELFFDSEDEVDQYILFNIEDLCTQMERLNVQSFVEELLGRSLEYRGRLNGIANTWIQQGAATNHLLNTLNIDS